MTTFTLIDQHQSKKIKEDDTLSLNTLMEWVKRLVVSILRMFGKVGNLFVQRAPSQPPLNMEALQQLLDFKKQLTGDSKFMTDKDAPTMRRAPPQEAQRHIPLPPMPPARDLADRLKTSNENELFLEIDDCSPELLKKIKAVLTPRIQAILNEPDKFSRTVPTDLPACMALAKELGAAAEGLRQLHRLRHQQAKIFAKDWPPDWRKNVDLLAAQSMSCIQSCATLVHASNAAHVDLIVSSFTKSAKTTRESILSHKDYQSGQKNLPDIGQLVGDPWITVEQILGSHTPVDPDPAVIDEEPAPKI